MKPIISFKNVRNLTIRLHQFKTNRHLYPDDRIRLWVGSGRDFVNSEARDQPMGRLLRDVQKVTLDITDDFWNFPDLNSKFHTSLESPVKLTFS